MGKRGLAAALIVAIIGGGIYYFTIYRPPREGTDKEQILRLIVEVEKAIEQGRVSGVMDHVSENYSDDHGLNRRMVHRMVMAGARDRRRLTLSVQQPQIEVSGDTATFTTEVDFSTDGGQSMTHLTVTGELRREGGRWMVVSADGWQGAESAYY
jgi:ketosteroid isomerase-like protein